MLNSVANVDYREFMERIRDASVDLVLTDPPYWTLDKWREVGTTTRLGGNREESKRRGWFETIDKDGLEYLMREIYRILKPDRHAVVMCDGQTLRYLLPMVDLGFSYVKPLVWDKAYSGMGYHFRCRHEYLVLFDKGKNRKPNDLSVADVFTHRPVRNGYPTEKPVALMEDIIKALTNEGEVVLDPFCGSGSTLVAAKKLGRQYIGNDISSDAFAITTNRLSGGVICSASVSRSLVCRAMLMRTSTRHPLDGQT